MRGGGVDRRGLIVGLLLMLGIVSMRSVPVAVAGQMESAKHLWPPGSGGPTDGASSMRESYDWPSIDSIQVNHPYYNTEQDSCWITVHMTNPIENHVFEWQLLVSVYRELVGYNYSFPPQDVILEPGQNTAEILWIDPGAPSGLEYDIEARFLQDQMRDNLVINGGFEGGLNGWQVFNDNPPGYGVETSTVWCEGDSDREARVYSTEYNTYGIQPELVQRVDIDPTEHSLVHLRFRMDTEDILWGYGIGVVYILTDRGGLYAFWHSTSAPPPNSDSAHYVRVYDSQWHARKVYLSELPLGVDEWIKIGAVAMLECGMPYCMAETNICLDDVGVCEDDDPTMEEFLAGFIKTDLGTSYIGDYQVALAECMGTSFPDMGAIEDVVPLLSTVHVWDKFHGNMCAAAVYQSMGDDRRRDLAALMAAYNLYEPMLDLLSLVFGRATVGVPEAQGVGVINTLMDLTYLRVHEEIHATDQDWEMLKTGLVDVATGVGGGFGLGADVAIRGVLWSELSLIEEGRFLEGTCTLDSLQATRCCLMPVVPESVTVATVNEGARILAGQDPIGAEDTLRFSATALENGPCDLFVVHRMEPEPITVGVANLWLSADDRVSVDLAGPGGTQDQYVFEIDYGGDGTVDSTVMRDPVGIPLWACCLDEVCALVTEENCLASGGNFLPEEGCDPNPCVSSTTVNRRAADERLLWLNPSVPSPANGYAEIAYGVPWSSDGSHVKLVVYDPTGRVVDVLVDERQSSGRHQAFWNGRDRSGGAVANGVYFLRLTWNDETCSRRILWSQ